MKFEVVFKDPDSLRECLTSAMQKDLAKTKGLSDDERKNLLESRVDDAMEICHLWFEWSEYLRVEVDLEKKTCTVLEVDR